MKRNLFYIVSLCFLSVIMSCGDGEDEPLMNVVTEPTDNPEEKAVTPDVDDLGRTDPGAEDIEKPNPDEEMDAPELVFVEPEAEGVDLALMDAIDGVLGRLREGYENEDLELYLSAFWIDGFQYTSDMGTHLDPFDDVMFEELKDEGKSAERVFAKYRDIELELSLPVHIIDAAPKKVEGWSHYRIQGFVNEGHALEGGFLGWFAEGSNKFTFEFRQGEWRITDWRDEAFDAEAIKAAANKGINLAPAAHPGGKLVTMWGIIKIR